MAIAECPPADLVLARGSVWAVVDKTAHAGCEAVRLRGAQPHNAGELRTLLTPFDRLRPLAPSTTPRVLRPRAWLHALRRAALQCHPYGGLRGAAECRIDLLPYQFEPASAMLAHGAERVLIADDVGLGKTIQAGLILSELAVRHGGLRALVTAPAALRAQWRDELRLHFEIDAIQADAGWLASIARSIPSDVNPWALPGVYVTSFDFIKRAEVLRPLEDVTWDVVVVDEAHAAAPATDRRAAIDAVARRSRRVVLLTATPHSGDPEQFSALCRIGHLPSPAAADNRAAIVMFRRSRADAAPELRRRTVLLSVRPSRAERRMHRLLERYAGLIRLESAGRDGLSGGLLAAIVLRKRALSSAGSLLASAIRRQELLSGTATVEEVQLRLPLADEDPLEDAAPDAALSSPGLRDRNLEQRLLRAIVRAAEAASRAETKTAYLLRLLRRVREPVIVFTEYRDTLSRLADALTSAGYRPQMLHGGMTADERVRTQRSFNEHDGLLLATDAASEGLNLQRRCRIVVHYELPWRPLRLQQRAGRVDRIGQKRPVHEILLVAADTAERLVLAPLARRVAGARGASAGASALFDSLNESRVAAAVLAGEDLSSGDGGRWCEPVIEMDLREACRREVERLELHRSWRSTSAGAAHAQPRGMFISALRTRCGKRSDADAIVVYRFSLSADGGQIVHAELLPVRVTIRNRWIAALSAHATREAMRELLASHDEAIRAALEEPLRLTTRSITDARITVIRTMLEREERIAALMPATARELVQAGLFDRRSVRSAESRRRAAGARLEEEDDRRRSLDASAPLTPSLSVVAVLLLPGGRAS